MINALQYAAFMAVHSDGKGSPAEGVPFPWSIAAGQEVVSAEERRVAEEYLATRTAIRS